MGGVEDHFVHPPKYANTAPQCRNEKSPPTVDQNGRLWVGLCAKSAERGEALRLEIIYQNPLWKGVKKSQFDHNL